MANRFDIVAIRGDHKCRIVVGMVIGPQTGCAIVYAAGI